MNDFETRPIRESSTGRFVKGHRALYRPIRQHDEEIFLHPTDPTRDSKGRLIAGPPPKTTRMAMGKFRQYMLENVPPEQMQTVMMELFKLTQKGPHGEEIQLKAIGMFLDRVLGKPSLELAVQQEKTVQNFNYDLAALSDDELDSLETLLSKTF